MFVKFNCFFQVAIFSATLGYGMDVLGVPSAVGTRDFSHFLKRSERVRHPLVRSMCANGSTFEGKAALA